MKRPEVTDEQLHELRKQGWSCGRIAAQFCMARQSVYYRLYIKPMTPPVPPGQRKRRREHARKHVRNKLLACNDGWYSVKCAECEALSPPTIGQGEAFDTAEAIGWRLFGGRCYCPRHAQKPT